MPCCQILSYSDYVRIAHVLPYDLRQPGGVQTHTLALSEALRRLGHDSEVFAPDRPLRLRLGGTRADLAWHPSDLLRLRDFLRRPRDILHIQEPMLPMLGPLSLIQSGARHTVTPTVITLHSAEPLARCFYRATAPITRRLLRRADALICATDVSRLVAQPCLSNLDEEVVMIPPCLDLSMFRAARAANAQQEPGLLLFVGRDEPRKGLPTLLRAMRLLPDCRLLVAGPVRPMTRRLAGDRVTFLGAVPHSRIPQLMATASCAVFPANGGEALGLVLIEAMASETPVVASDIPGYRVATDDGAAAVLSPPNAPASLAAQIDSLLGDGERCARLVERGRAVVQRFDADAIARRHVDLYRALVRP